MSNEDQKPRLSNFEVEEKALEADTILHNPVFIEAIEQVYSRAVGTLLSADVGSLTATHAHGIMKAIVDIQAQLKEYIADHKVRQKYNKGDK